MTYIFLPINTYNTCSQFLWPCLFYFQKWATSRVEWIRIQKAKMDPIWLVWYEYTFSNGWWL